MREEAVLEECSGIPHRLVGTRVLGDDAYNAVDQRVKEMYCADYFKYCFVHPNAIDTLSNLSGDYKLAIAANQPKGVFRQAMVEAGLLGFFQMNGISGDIGISKPSLAFFEYILAEIGVAPTDAIMVGDRIDNDIAPAQSLGMKTVHVRMTPQAQGYRPTDELGSVYLESLGRAPSRGSGAGNESVQPDVTVAEVQEIPNGVKELD